VQELETGTVEAKLIVKLETAQTELPHDLCLSMKLLASQTSGASATGVTVT
jgi:hypothetical protein